VLLRRDAPLGSKWLHAHAGAVIFDRMRRCFNYVSSWRSNSACRGMATAQAAYLFAFHPINGAR
jgi:hypothetical protein